MDCQGRSPDSTWTLTHTLGDLERLSRMEKRRSMDYGHRVHADENEECQDQDQDQDQGRKRGSREEVEDNKTSPLC